ncbi:MAG: endolytic transglycosylase MltG [Bacteroidales bacterium]|nr:endolytic transglycosylase MltG [Bacteroidales bacterium]MBN2762077.1 endolytic transglycosylase MltG [Bacteroidales bacterium]
MRGSVAIKTILYAILVIFIITGIKISDIYHKAYGANIFTPDEKSYYLYIPTGAEIDDVYSLLYEADLVKNKKTFEWVVERKKYYKRINAGKYRIRNRMSNNELVNMLRAGLQEPVQVVLNNIRTTEELANKVAAQIEPDTASLLNLLREDSIIEELGFNDHTILGMFIPNTYELWWNISAKGFIERMKKEYDRFWNKERSYKAKQIGLDYNEVITLASIIVNETGKTEEYRRIAGVYINRLNKGIKLQADPTVKYALGNFEITRVLKKQTTVDSPYNTYKYYGLPPGPICMPSILAIDAVLHYEKHDFIYFCAKEDFSGYHNFARTLEQHNRNARSYQRALNRRRILK